MSKRGGRRAINGDLVTSTVTKSPEISVEQPFVGEFLTRRVSYPPKFAAALSP